VTVVEDGAMVVVVVLVVEVEVDDCSAVRALFLRSSNG
jgi:hypothetical protein